MNTNYKRRKLFFAIPLMILAFLGLGGLAVMLLWNAILPSTIAGVNTLTYPKAVGLLVLSKILFSGFKGRRGGNYPTPFWKEKMRTMSEEERQKFKEEWKKRCGNS